MQPVEVWGAARLYNVACLGVGASAWASVCDTTETTPPLSAEWMRASIVRTRMWSVGALRAGPKKKEYPSFAAKELITRDLDPRVRHHAAARASQCQNRPV